MGRYSNLFARGEGGFIGDKRKLGKNDILLVKLLRGFGARENYIHLSVSVISAAFWLGFTAWGAAEGGRAGAANTA